jgi:DNA-binding transcriptional LysR family regulator
MLTLSQSAVSRQISALEEEITTPLFQRHARGLTLTDEGEMLYLAVTDVLSRLAQAEEALKNVRESPRGALKITSSHGIGTYWLVPRLDDFLKEYPEVEVHLVMEDRELDLAQREADLAIRMRAPVQADLIQRKLFTVHYHVYASPAYVKRFGEPKSYEDLDNHRIVSFGGTSPSYLTAVHWLGTIGRDQRNPRPIHLVVNNITAMKRAVDSGAGIAVLPDYLIETGSPLVQLMRETEMPQLESYLVYPEEMKSVARVQVFRDFLIQKAQRWTY